MKLLSIFLSLLLCSSLLSASFIRVDPKSQFFVDSYNRVRIFHGVNAVFKDPPFYPPILDRFDANNSLSDPDFANLRNWGFNMIRLHVAWEGVESEKGKYNIEYLNVLKNISKKAEKYGIYVLLDAHQDVMNKKFCGEGFPDWTASPDPEPSYKQFPFPLTFKLNRDDHGVPLRNECINHSFFNYYYTWDVGVAFQRLYDNWQGLRTQFANFWAVVASNFQNETNILGYEILNEPWVGNIYEHPELLLPTGEADRRYLVPMYEEVHQMVRRVDDHHMIFYEPSVTDWKEIGFETGPGGRNYDDRQVLSYHVYCNYKDEHGDPKSKAICRFEDDEFFKWRIENSKKIGGGAFLTEFGAVSEKPIAIDDLEWVLRQADKNLQSWAYWQFKYYDDFTTASNPGNRESFYDANGDLQHLKVRALSYTYAPIICGIPSKMEFNPKSIEFDLVYAAINCSEQPTVIYLNEEWYYKPLGYDVRVFPENSVIVKHVESNYLQLFHTPSVKAGTQIVVKIKRSEGQNSQKPVNS